jgi:hypothetical protein
MAAGPLTCISLYVLWGWPQVFWGIPIWAVIVLAMYVYEEFMTGNRTERRRQQSMPFAPQDAIDEILGVRRDLSRARSREYQREVEEIARRHRKRKGE